MLHCTHVGWFVCNAPPLYIQPHSLFITVITMDAQSTTTSTQPQAVVIIDMIAPAQAKQTECKNANRIRGGGAGKVYTAKYIPRVYGKLTGSIGLLHRSY